MALYSLADSVVDIENKYDFLTRQCVEYQYSGTAPADFTVRVTEEDIRAEQNMTPDIRYPAGYLESVYGSLPNALGNRAIPVILGVNSRRLLLRWKVFEF